MWTFSNSTWKGQLKNVQDEISRPLGSREIQKTKVETVLRDTLYNLSRHVPCMYKEIESMKRTK